MCLNLFTEKLKDVLKSVLPIFLIVLILNFTITPLETPLIVNFVIGTLLIIFGLVIFLAGVDIGIAPLGSLMGSALTKTNKIWILTVGGIILGFLISIAEPSLLVLASQVDLITSGQISSASILIVVSVGLAVLLALGFIRTVYNVPLYIVLTILYLIIFILALFTAPEFLAIAFDASGATTGVLAVPFILSLALGISSAKKVSAASEKDSFGLVAVASAGAIISVLILSMFAKNNTYALSFENSPAQPVSVAAAFLGMIPGLMKEGISSLLPLLVLFMVFQKIAFNLKKKAFRRILIGFIYAFVGLVLFLLGVNAGFMEVGRTVGARLANMDNKLIVIGIGFIIGFVTILAEPAVYVLTHQIDDVTSGYVKKGAVLAALSIGVGFAIALSVIRILTPSLQLWYYLLPGYIISIAMAFFVPKLFVGIAFDAGGVATGPMTATFLLAFTHGVAEAADGADILIDSFGMISLVALTPIITLQVLGLMFKLKSKKGGI